MSKTAKYNREIFPFAGVFEDLTEVTIEQELSPLRAYVRYQQARQRYQLHHSPDYFSTSITSGGHARRPNVESRAIVEKNTENAQQLLGELAVAKVITPDRAILPADFGYVPHWRQSDYITLWLAVIGGPDFGKTKPDHEAAFFAMRLGTALEREAVNLDIMNNSKMEPQLRAPEYFKFTRAFANVVPRAPFRTRPVNRVINLLDPKDSLGCRTERVFAHTQNIPVFDINVAGPGPEALDVIEDDLLRKDLETIVSYGGTTVELLPGNQFVLREVPVLEGI